MNVMLATEDNDLGLVEANTATRRAQKHANETGKPVTVRHPVTDKLLAKILPMKPAKGKGKTAKAKPASKPKAAAKKAASAKPKAAAKAAKPKAERAPKGMVVKILALASRKGGVSPAELNKVTKWKGAPLKWLFSNPKKNGYCDRWGYKFEVRQIDDETRYCTTAK
jgi:hypothetical protein